MLFISPMQIIFMGTLLVVMIITSLVLASKNESTFKFLIWVAIILGLPFIGSVSYLIKHYTSLNTKNNNALVN
ncbi:PLDc N-terminal domain-containing protein [Winogradskyella undariae]|uniref:PLDc N-terminal domain-containing protein n=1 Tax=Winogradskyella undariae TaxID=1285465 RepID=UPI00156AEA05|nr:PLDc N-terminal domain-containing protein [Winogradskyella undariae]NRR91559.1 PLDc N-terminal domain-containing protein [Winogradskyella undariae]